MTEPTRMRDDPAADDALRDLVRDAPATPAMPPALRAALGAKVTALSTAPVVPAGVQAAWPWAQVGVAAVVVALGAVAWRAATPRPSHARVAAPARPAPSPTSPSVAAPAAAPTTSVRGPATPQPAAHAPRATPAARPRPTAQPEGAPALAQAPAATTGVAAAPPTTAAVGDATGRAQSTARRVAEHRLLEQARAASRAGRDVEALALVAEHERAFADGALVEEREVIAVEVLARRGAAAARARGDAFLARWPASLYAARVRGLVGATVDLEMARDGGVHGRAGGSP